MEEYSRRQSNDHCRRDGGYGPDDLFLGAEEEEEPQQQHQQKRESKKKETRINCSMYFRVVVRYLPTTYSAQEVSKCVGGGGQLFSRGWMVFR